MKKRKNFAVTRIFLIALVLMLLTALFVCGCSGLPSAEIFSAGDAGSVVVGIKDARVLYQAKNLELIQDDYLIDVDGDTETSVNVFERWPEGSIMDSVSWEAQGAVQADYIPAERHLGNVEVNGLVYDTYVVSAFALPGREDGDISFSGNDERGDYFVLIAEADIGDVSVEVVQKRPFTYTAEDAKEALSAIVPTTGRPLTTEARRKTGVTIESDGRSVIIKGDFPEHPETMISDSTLQLSKADAAGNISYFLTYFEEGEDVSLYSDGEITDRWETTYDGRAVTVLEEENEGASILDVFAQLDDTYYLVICQDAGGASDFSEDDVRALLSHVQF